MVAILVTADCTRGRLRLSLRPPLKPMLRLETSMVDMLLAELDMVMVLVMLPAMSTEVPRDIEVLETTTEDVTTVCTRGLLMLATSDMLPTMPALDVASSVSPGPSPTTASVFTTKHQPKYSTNEKLVSTREPYLIQSKSKFISEINMYKILVFRDSNCTIIQFEFLKT